MYRVERERRSVKRVIHQLADELLARRNDPEARVKLLTIQTIAFRAGWNELYEKLRFKSGLHNNEWTTSRPEPDEEPKEKWFQR